VVRSSGRTKRQVYLTLHRHGKDYATANAAFAEDTLIVYDTPYLTVRIFCGIVASLDIEWLQFDATAAFLDAKVHGKIYVQKPQGLQDGTSRVCEFRQALYSLRISPP
jgi:hypothetical protein